MALKRLFSQSTLMPLLSGGLLLALTWPVWHWLWGEWLGNDYYSHGILVPLVVVFLVVQRLRNDRSVWSGGEISRSEGLVVLSMSLLLFLYFYYGRAYYLAAFAMIGLLIGLIWSLWGAHLVRKLIFPIGYLVLMVPLPFVERATLPLALFTGVCATGVVQWLGLEVTVVGNAVTLPNANLVIGAQCSGVNSLIALVSLMALSAYLLDGPLWGRLMLVATAAPLAILGNILRVASLLFVARAYGAQAAFTFYHDYSGIVFFLAIILLMFPLTQLLQARTFRMEVI
jgi:exosortase